MKRIRSAADAAEDWLIANDPDGPGVTPVRGRCQWPIIGWRLHVWGPWERHLISFQRRRCAKCGFMEERMV